MNLNDSKQPSILMKTRFSKPIRFLSALGLVLWAVRPHAGAQTPAQLAIQTYAGLTITGAVGTVYQIQYITDLAQTNAWRCLEFLQLPATNYLWFDPTAPATGRRFYRVVAFPAPTNLVFIPPGTFRMGSPTNEVDRGDSEGPQTAVTISMVGFIILEPKQAPREPAAQAKVLSSAAGSWARYCF